MLLSGPQDDRVLPADLYRRLTTDLGANGCKVAADLAGERLEAVLAGGPDLIKVSHEELLADGRAKSEDADDLVAAMHTLRDDGAGTIIVSRAGAAPALALLDEGGSGGRGGDVVEVVMPSLEPADPPRRGRLHDRRFLAALASGRPIREALQVGAACGALNVVRHGLGTGGAASSTPSPSGSSCGMEAADDTGRRAGHLEIHPDRRDERVPRALVTNDDGIDSPGLLVLAAAAVQAGLEVIVAAPAEQSSGASAALDRHAPRGPHRRRPAASCPGWTASRRGRWRPSRGTSSSRRSTGGSTRRRTSCCRGSTTARTSGGPCCTRAPWAPPSRWGSATPAGWPSCSTSRCTRPASGTGRARPRSSPRCCELLLDSPEGTVLSLNVPDRPADDLGPLRHARLARGGAVQARVDEIRDGDLRLGEIEVGDEPEEGTDSALLVAGHPTLTALRSVTEADDERVQKWLADRDR